MNLMKYFALALMIGFGAAGLTGCDDGPAEEAGEKIDNIGDDMEDAAEDAADDIEDAIDD